MVVMFPQLLVSVPSAFRRVSKCGPHCFRDAPFGPVVFIILTIPRKHTLQKPPWKKDTRCIKKEIPLRLGLVQSLFHSTGWRIKKKEGCFWVSGLVDQAHTHYHLLHLTCKYMRSLITWVAGSWTLRNEITFIFSGDLS